MLTIATFSVCLAARFLFPIVPNVALMLAMAVTHGWRVLGREPQRD